MHDVHQAIEVLREITGQPDLVFEGGDHAEIIFDGVPVGFVAIDRRHIELVTPLADLAISLDASTLMRLMTANYLGTATGSARLAYDPGRRQIALCERLDVRPLDAGDLRERVADFLQAAAFWNGLSGRGIARDSGASETDFSAMNLHMIRG